MKKPCGSSQTYRESLPVDVRNRYDDKTVGVIGCDPYEVASSEFDKDKSKWPDLSLVDVIHYLMFQLSAYTKDQLRNYKSLEAFGLFQVGWIWETLYKNVNGHHLLRAKVTHSMAVRNRLLDAWVIVGNDGSILSGHCTCMAGLGECCSHVAAILCALETWSRIRQEVTVTDVPAYWMFPTAARFEAPYKRIREMDCTSAIKKRKLGESPPPSETPLSSNIPSPTKGEERDFFRGLAAVMPNAAILSLDCEFSDNFVPKSVLGNWPIDMTSLFNRDYEEDDINTIIKDGEAVDISVTKEQAIYVASQTIDQTGSSFWYKYRNGRVTASKFRATTHTNLNKPSVSLLKSICYVNSNVLTTPSLDWGRKKETLAKSVYLTGMETDHVNFIMKESGLVLNEEHQQFGASPDGLVECECCGKGCLEIKCPYTARDSSSLNLDWLECGPDGPKKLSRDHPYFFQV